MSNTSFQTIEEWLRSLWDQEMNDEYYIDHNDPISMAQAKPQHTLESKADDSDFALLSPESQCFLKARWAKLFPEPVGQPMGLMDEIPFEES